MTATESIPGVHVPVVAEAAATGRTAELYQMLRDATGMPFVHDVFRLTSTRPDLLEIVAVGFTRMFGDGGLLPRETRELIASWTSRLNSCPYCSGTHAYFMHAFGAHADLVSAVTSAERVEDLPVDEKMQVLLRLTSKVTVSAYKVTDADWAEVAAAGWSNAETLEAVFCASLFNFINRLVDATGLGDTAR